MNCQELATAAVEQLATKVFILNNQHLGMVVQVGGGGWVDVGVGGLEGRPLASRCRTACAWCELAVLTQHAACLQAA